MLSTLPDPLRRKLPIKVFLIASIILICGVFFLGLVSLKFKIIPSFVSTTRASNIETEVFGFAPYWTLDKLENIDWNLLTTFAYFSLPVGAGGTIDKASYEWSVFTGERLENYFDRANNNNVRRVVTLTQMDPATIEIFLSNPDAWEVIADETADILSSYNLDGVNIDFEYIPSNSYLRTRFSEFVDAYTTQVKKSHPNSYITVSVLASSVRFNRIYDIGRLAATTDGIFMMAYDFYYPGSQSAGPSSPLYGYYNGGGPFWYDVSTAVDDFLEVAPSEKIIMGVPYYGWNYPTYTPKPQALRVTGATSFATTQKKAWESPLLSTTPVGGWDEDAKVSWRGYWDVNGWHVVYMEDKKSLTYKYNFAREKKLGGVGIWALGFDEGQQELWNTLRENI